MYGTTSGTDPYSTPLEYYMVNPDLPYSAYSTEGSTWRGELAIPWKVITEQAGRPVLLRFNFIQHRTETGESASWPARSTSAEMIRSQESSLSATVARGDEC